MRFWRSFNSGAFRFALLIAALFAIGSALLLGVVEHSISVYANEASAGGLLSETRIFAGELEQGGRADLLRAIRRHQIVSPEQPYRYLLVGADGKRIAGDLPDSTLRIGPGTFRDPSDGGDAAEVMQTLGTRLADGSRLVVGTDAYDIERVRHKLGHITVIAGVAVTFLALVGGYLVGGLFLRRLEGVNDAVERIMSGTLSERLPRIGMSPEFDHLSTNLNAMLDRISDLMDGLRQVSTDIAHDLRTPLTRLQHRLEALQGEQSVKRYEEGVDDALAQTAEILAIFKALLRIGQIEGEGARHFQPVDVSNILDTIAQAYAPEAEDQGRTIRTSIASQEMVSGDPELLAQMFANLMDNAIKHTPRGACVAVSLSRISGKLVASVSDNGPGIPASERSKVLRRFYRMDTSRSTPGAGLGLSLVAAIASLHEATLSLGDNGPGLKVDISFSRILD